MKISVILGHPDPGSFNHAIARAVVTELKRRRHTVYFHDLYAESFEPLLRAREIPKDARLDRKLKRYCRELAQSDGVVVIHPNWWGQPPAILKGWIDRVVRPGVAYEFLAGDSGAGVPLGLLKARTAIVFNTSNTPRAREKKVFGDPLEALWKNCVFALCGVKRFRRRMYGMIVTSRAGQRATWLRDAVRLVRREF